MIAAFDCSFDPVIAFADDLQDAGAQPEETDPDYAVPDGTPKEIMDFLGELKSRKTKFANRREEIDHLIKLYRAYIEAGDKILESGHDGEGCGKRRKNETELADGAGRKRYRRFRQRGDGSRCEVAIRQTRASRKSCRMTIGHRSAS